MMQELANNSLICSAALRTKGISYSEFPPVTQLDICGHCRQVATQLVRCR